MLWLYSVQYFLPGVSNLAEQRIDPPSATGVSAQLHRIDVDPGSVFFQSFAGQPACSQVDGGYRLQERPGSWAGTGHYRRSAFYPATVAFSFPLVLLAVLITALGVAALQVVANPYVAALGDSRTASARLTMTSGINSLGTTVAPYLGAVVLFSVHRVEPGSQSGSGAGALPDNSSSCSGAGYCHQNSEAARASSGC